jgi:hypothetical protein
LAVATAELVSTALAPIIAAQRTVFFITAIPFRSRRVLGAHSLEIPRPAAIHVRKAGRLLD